MPSTRACLSVCLGSQLLARALGQVVQSPVKESGFEPLRPTPDAKDDPLSLYADGDMVFQ